MSQAGQREGGRTIDSSRGTRQITTLRNDPISSPKTPQTTSRRSPTGTFFYDVLLGHGQAVTRRPDAGVNKRAIGAALRLDAAGLAVVEPQNRVRTLVLG